MKGMWSIPQHGGEHGNHKLSPSRSKCKCGINLINKVNVDHFENSCKCQMYIKSNHITIYSKYMAANTATTNYHPAAQNVNVD